MPNGAIIEELTAEFKNDLSEIKSEIAQWNELVSKPDKDRDYAQIFLKNRKLMQLNQNRFSSLGLPKQVHVKASIKIPEINEGDLLIPLTTANKNFAKKYNETKLAKRKRFLLIAFENKISEQFWNKVELNAKRLYYDVRQKDILSIYSNIIPLILKNYSLDYDQLQTKYKYVSLRRYVAVPEQTLKEKESAMTIKMINVILSLRSIFFRFIMPVKINDDIDIATSDLVHIYTRQSFRDPETRQILNDQHFALKELYNHVLRSDRGDVKKQLKTATGFAEKTRLNSLQNAIKTLMNSEYGASGASFFPLFNPYIPSMTTFSARASIHFLSKLLASNTLFVDYDFADANEELISTLIENKIIKNIEIVTTDDVQDKLKYFNCLDRCKRIEDRSLLTLSSTPQPDELIKITITPARVIYQDTDSNYYLIDDIAKIIFGDNHQINPHDIKKIMESMIAHNSLFINLVDTMINRPPGAVNFEHAFIICRHFNAKKKYYGIDYDQSMSDVEPDGFPNEWKIVPGKTTWPNKNGEFFEVDEHKLIDERVDYFSYTKQLNIKATGIDLARRDQFKFINFMHLNMIKNDLKLIHFENNSWHDVENISLYNLMLNSLNEFELSFKQLVRQVRSRTNDNDHEDSPSPFKFKFEDFSKNIKYNPDKKNKTFEEMNTFLNSIGTEYAKSFIPESYKIVETIVLNISSSCDLVKFICNVSANTPGLSQENVQKINDIATKKCEMINNKANKNKVCLRTFSKELVDAFAEHEHINALILIDLEYYKTRLIKGLTKYLIEELAPKDIEGIRLLATDDKDKLDRINKLQVKIMNKLLTAHKNSLLNGNQLQDFERRFNRAITLNKTNKVVMTDDKFIYLLKRWQLRSFTDFNAKSHELLDQCNRRIESIKNDIERYKSLLQESQQIDSVNFKELLITANRELDNICILRCAHIDDSRIQELNDKLRQNASTITRKNYLYECEFNLVNVLPKEWYKLTKPACMKKIANHKSIFKSSPLDDLIKEIKTSMRRDDDDTNIKRKAHIESLLQLLVFKLIVTN